MRKPKKGQRYFMVNSRFQVKETTHMGSKKAEDRIEAGNYFKTRSEANAFAYLIKELAKGNLTGFKRRWWRVW